MSMEKAEPKSPEATEVAPLDQPDKAAAAGKAAGGGLPVVTGATRRKLESRRKLMAAARKLFVERGYHETRPQDISRAAGVGHGTFYLHFEDKLDCFLAFTDEAVDELGEFMEIHEAVGETLEDDIRKRLAAIFEYSDENPGVLNAALTDISVLSTGDTGKKMPVDRWAEMWTAQMEHWIEAGEAFASLDTRMAGYLIVGAIRQGGAYGYLRRLEREEIVESITRLFVRALKK
tara:strand:- start:87 stop:785 length:699 start_codon:yes stop_codon:yes gene_type:complete